MSQQYKIETQCTVTDPAEHQRRTNHAFDLILNFKLDIPTSKTVRRQKKVSLATNELVVEHP